MNRAEYIWYSSEIKTIGSIVGRYSKENVIERMWLESRLKEARAAIQGVTMPVPHSIEVFMTKRGMRIFCQS